MATPVRNVTPVVVDELARFELAMKKQIGATDRQSGTATLVGGTVTVSSLTVRPGSNVKASINTVGGTPGHLTAPVASRTNGIGSGSIVITSSSGTDTSTVDWELVNTTPHLDASEQTITAANASDLATSLTLVAQIAAVFYGVAQLGAPYPGHLNDVQAHKVADVTNVRAAAAATDLATAITLANEIKVDYEAHRVSTTHHYISDSVNSIAAANASDQGTLNTLLNELKGDINLHMAAAPLNNASVARVTPL